MCRRLVCQNASSSHFFIVNRIPGDVLKAPNKPYLACKSDFDDLNDGRMICSRERRHMRQKNFGGVECVFYSFSLKNIFPRPPVKNRRW